MKPCLTVLMLVLFTGCGRERHAENARLQAFAALPDWSGRWEQYDVDVSGLLSEAMVGDLAALRPPYNAAWQARFDQALAEHANEPPPAKVCTIGFPGLMIFSPLMFEVLISPEETALIFSQRETRHIHTDGRAPPSSDGLWPTPWGYSTGYWQGQTLIVESVATNSPLTPFVFAPLAFAPLSSRVRFIERLQRLDRNTLEDQITVDDADAFVRPWQLVRRYHRVDMTELIDEDCWGNDRNPVVEGRQTIVPAGGAA